MSTTHVYPAGGWLPEGAHLQLEWDDQGRDFATNWRGVVQAPGNGVCLNVLSDAPFPSGFGPHYPVVRIDTGKFAGHEFYIGHNTALVSPGQRFTFGTPLSHADQGQNWASTTGGWVELGEAFGGLPGPKSGRKWFDPLLESPLKIKVPNRTLHFGMWGWDVLRMTRDLHDCGYLSRAWFHFNSQVQGAVVRFKRKHNLPVPKPNGGRVDDATAVLIAHIGHHCKATKRKEV